MKPTCACAQPIVRKKETLAFNSWTAVDQLRLIRRCIEVGIVVFRKFYGMMAERTNIGSSIDLACMVPTVGVFQ